MSVPGGARLTAALAALADGKRRAVIGALLAEPRRAGDLAKAVALTPPALSRHLRILRRAGLVTEAGDAADARVRVYRVREAGFAPLRSYLDDVEAYWAVQLASFKAHAERRAK